LSPYLGAEVSGRVTQTILRGATIFDGREPVGPARGASLLHRGQAS
jgi:dihydroorotase-like cyclic amidohydrolase